MPNQSIPAVPPPVVDPRALAMCVLALKQAVDSLAGRLNANDQAVRFSDFLGLLEQYLPLVNPAKVKQFFITGGSVVTSWVTASFPVTTDAQVYFVDSTGGPITATMPSAPALGDTYEIADATGQAGANNITVAGNGYNIQGQPNLVLRIAYGFIKLRFTGAQWIQAQ